MYTVQPSIEMKYIVLIIEYINDIHKRVLKLNLPFGMTIARAGTSHDHVVHRVVVPAHRRNQFKNGSECRSVLQSESVNLGNAKDNSHHL